MDLQCFTARPQQLLQISRGIPDQSDKSGVPHRSLRDMLHSGKRRVGNPGTGHGHPSGDSAADVVVMNVIRPPSVRDMLRPLAVKPLVVNLIRPAHIWATPEPGGNKTRAQR